MKKGIAAAVSAGLMILVSILVCRFPFGGQETAQEVKAMENSEVSVQYTTSGTGKTASRKGTSPKEVRILGLKAQRVSAKKITLQWNGNTEVPVKSYLIQKYDNRQAKPVWKNVGSVAVKNKSTKVYQYTDKLKSSKPQQYVYRVIPRFSDPGAYAAVKEKGIVCSNLKVCLDPGHFAGRNAVTGSNSYGYAEGDFTLLLAKKLKKQLETDYGISVCMTRKSGSISIGGYKDAALDSGHISLRGAYAGKQGCDLFLSLHTNANENHANGAGTFDQPIEINKPILIANDLVLSSATLRGVCNEVGKNLAKTGYQLGISSRGDFKAISGKKAKEWTVSYNDSIKEPGTVVCRHGSSGQYYGVLKGSQEAGVPGVIIEHGFHTVEKMRYQAMKGKLKDKWAEADAQGIAAGFGFHKIQ